MHKLDMYWFICAGPIVIILLILLLLSFFIPNTRTPPADIIFITCLFELFLVSSVVAQAGRYLLYSAYYFEHNVDSSPSPPTDFNTFCNASGFIYMLGIAGINIYNIIFCLMLAFTVKNALKNKYFSMACYHCAGTVLSLLLPVTIFVLNQTGK
jgi:hypothetical protein